MKKKRKTIEEIFALYRKLYFNIEYDRIKQEIQDIWTSIEENQQIKRPDNLDNIIKTFNNYQFDIFNRTIEHYPNKDKFYIGFLNLQNFNAEASFIDGHKIILVDNYLTSFFMEVILALYALTYDTHYGTGKDKNIEYFLNYCFYKFHYGSSSSKNPYLSYENIFSELAKIEHQFLFESTVSQNAILYFILGHELGHFYFNHDSIKKEITKTKSQFFITNELDADHFGYNIFLKVTDEIRENDNTNISSHFDRIPLLMFDIMEKYYQTFNIDYTAHNHPEPITRKNNLLEKNKHLFSIEGEKLYFDLLETLNEVEIFQHN